MRVKTKPGNLVEVHRGPELGRGRALYKLGINGKNDTIWAVEMLDSGDPIPVPETGMDLVSEHMN